MTVIGSTVETEAIGTDAPSHAERMWLQANWSCTPKPPKFPRERIAAICCLSG